LSAHGAGELSEMPSEQVQSGEEEEEEEGEDIVFGVEDIEEAPIVKKKDTKPSKAHKPSKPTQPKRSREEPPQIDSEKIKKGIKKVKKEISDTKKAEAVRSLLDSFEVPSSEANIKLWVRHLGTLVKVAAETTLE
jgi:hypothetical protein